MFRTILTYAIILAIALIVGCSSGDLNPAGPIAGDDSTQCPVANDHFKLPSESIA